MFFLRRLLCAGLLTVAMAGHAAAATFTLDFSLPAPILNPPATSTTGDVFQNVTGSVGGLRRSPWEDTAFENGAYTSVSGGATATYAFGTTMKEIELMWGSVDTYNFIDFYLGATLVDTLGGTALITANPAAAPEASGFVVASIMAASPFDRIVIRSDTNAFEFGTLTATPVPLPPAILTLVAALAGLGVAGRRKRRLAAA